MWPSETAPIREEERFDEGRVARYLQHRLPEVFGDHPITFSQFPGGKANLTYLARAGDTELVLRRPPLGPVAPGGHDMAREFRVLSELWRAFPAAPRALHYCEDPEIMGKPFVVMERRRGFVIRHEWPPSLGVAERSTAAVSLVDTLVELHRVSPEAVGLSELGRPDGFVARQVSGWKARWDRAKTREVLDMEAAAAVLAASIPSPQAATLLHNDFKLDNVMIDEDGRVAAVLDWDMATLGDPLVDVGTMLAYWADRDDALSPVMGEGAVHLAGILDREGAIGRYASGSGFDLAALDFYVALAYFRIAVIVEQIYARFVAGQTRDDRFEALAGVAPALAARARELGDGWRVRGGTR